MAIHPTAIISPRAEIAPDVEIGPWVIIEDDVVIGAGCELAAHVIVKRYTRLGQRNRVHQHAIIGGEPQHTGYRGEASALLVGDDNIFRENVTIHRATADEATIVGSRNFLMVGAHIGHNCVIGNDCVAGMHSALGGHVELEDHVVLGHQTRVHQFVRVGRFATVGSGCKVAQDVLPFLFSGGEPCRVRGLNVAALSRAGVSAEQQQRIDDALNLLLHSGRSRGAALEEMEQLQDVNVAHLVQFVRASRRGFTREPRRKSPAPAGACNDTAVPHDAFAV